MDKTISSAEPATLCYLDSTQITGPLDDFRGAEVRMTSDGKIGRLDGIVVDPTERRVRYLVVDNERWVNHHRYLVPIGATRVDVERQVLCLEGDGTDLMNCEEFDRNQFRSFSFRPR
jgi:sporulation protein YlmC with PRC-barrel domain